MLYWFCQEVITINTRIKEIRKYFSLNQTEFGERIGIKQTSVAGYERGARIPIDAVIKSICREFNVNEDWLRTGNGEMFNPLPEDEEVAVYVSELLEDKDNPLYQLSVDIMVTYNQLSPQSQEALRDFSAKLRENMAKKKES